MEVAERPTILIYSPVAAGAPYLVINENMVYFQSAGLATGMFGVTDFG